jgi:hypothetical protein
MGYAEIIPVTPDQLDVCDSCKQQGLKRSGHAIKDVHGEAVLWFCFNCKAKILAQ